MPFELLSSLRDLALFAFSEIVVRAELLFSPAGRVRKLRIQVIDESFVDVWLSGEGDYAFHWERRFLDGTLYRHDNAPHKAWREISTFPKHFHDGTEQNVAASRISDSPTEALREFLTFVRTRL